jgi:hypothetical protein
MKISRQDFLKKGALATTGAGALSLIGMEMLGSQKATAAPTGFTWPYPYATLDPEVVRIKGHDLYFAGYACCSGAFTAIIQALADTVGDPYTTFPVEMMLFGGGGAAGWGTLCGALNGSASAISLVTEKTVANALINELIGWYTTAKFPSDQSNTNAVNHANTHNDFDMVLPQEVCGSPLCHISVTSWCVAADKTVGSNERKERCARLCGDVASKAVELLNAQFAGTFVAEYQTPESVADCLACHGGSGMVANVSSKMTCIPCHGEPHASGVDNVGLNHEFTIKQNYPNPFNSGTSIEFNLKKEEKITIEVYNLNGQHIKTIASQKSFSPGDHTLQWNGENEDGQSVKAGMYIFRIRAGKGVKTVSMMKM